MLWSRYVNICAGLGRLQRSHPGCRLRVRAAVTQSHVEVFTSLIWQCGNKYANCDVISVQIKCGPLFSVWGVSVVTLLKSLLCSQASWPRFHTHTYFQVEVLIGFSRPSLMIFNVSLIKHHPDTLWRLWLSLPHFIISDSVNNITL